MKNSLYNIESYGADYSVEHLVMMYNRDDLVIPEFQRKYVWTLKQASRFIESCVLGLPIPSFFFFKEDTETKYLVVDGQQRIMTLVNFKSGYFKSEKTPFRLSGVNEMLEGKSYQDLSTELKRRFDYSLLRITIFKQTEPSQGMESVYEVFSRLNTGGLKLTSHEVRNAVIRGKINDFIADLNKNVDWRELYGKKNADIHMKDEELIVRFFALKDNGSIYAPPMAEFLNIYMDENKNAEDSWFVNQREIFAATAKSINTVLGKKAFRIKSTLNSAMSDSIMVAFADEFSKNSNKLDNKKIKQGYNKLVLDVNYQEAIETGTSQSKKVQLRIDLAKKYLFDV